MLALRRKSFGGYLISLNSEEGTFFLNVILRVACSKLYRQSGPNKMAPLVSILWEWAQ